MRNATERRDTSPWLRDQKNRVFVLRSQKFHGRNFSKGSHRFHPSVGQSDLAVSVIIARSWKERGGRMGRYWLPRMRGLYCCEPVPTKAVKQTVIISSIIVLYLCGDRRCKV
jgi:hypothetical protein